MQKVKVSLIIAVVISVLVPTLTCQVPSSVKAQGAGVDAALVIDGSGSIDSADFALQKEGIKAAVQDPLIVPRDGSITLTVVQYAGNTTQVHVPYTTINSGSDVISITSQIDGIVQIGGQTNPGDGINRAMDVLNAEGNTANQQNICLSTDGLPNAGADVETALNNAKGSSMGLDRFTVIAIEDPPHYYADDFEAYYGPLVFGGGSVTVVENSIEFARSVGGCLAGTVELIGLEVNQAIQDWNNSIQLIEGKRTYVRAHIQSVSQTPTRAFARLHGTRGGTDLPGSPLPPINQQGSIVALPNASAQRHELDQSLNFRLPPSWLSGAVELQVEAAGTQLECKESAGTPDDCTVEITFEPTARLEIEFVGIKWIENNTTYEPSIGDYSELAARLRAIYPIASGTEGLDWRWFDIEWDGPTPDDHDVLNDINSRLRRHRMHDLCFPILGCDRIYYGVVVGPVPDVMGLANGIPGGIASGSLPQNRFVTGRNTHAHEIGHLLERHHAVHPPVIDPIPILRLDDYKEGWCGEEAAAAAPDFPYSAQIGGRTVATIGPMQAGEDALVFGLDTHLIERQDPNTRARAVISPTEHYELMSYCGQFPDTFQWPSDFTYDGLRTAINDRFEVAAAAPNQTETAVNAESPDEYLIIPGTIDFENDTVVFEPFSVLSSPVAPPSPPPGDYTLELLDGASNVIREIPFEPDISMGNDFPFSFATFAIPVLVDPAIRQARVLHQGEILASRSGSPNPPTVEVVFPNGGESLDGTQATLEWTGSDLDGDPLTYIVQYSADGGSTWKTLVVDWPNQSYDISLDLLEETNNGLIRVLASDGFDSDTDTSDGPFSVPNSSPQVFILSPDDESLFLGTQSILFEGEAVDREDQKLTGSSLEWESDRDGPLGTGEILTSKATQLSEGRHIITLTATDQVGSTDTASVEIDVFHFAPPATTGILKKSVSPETVSPEGTVQYTIELENTGSTEAIDVAILDLLPVGFTYQPGSTHGVTPDDPIISGQQLVWPGPYPVPSGETLTLSFSANSSDEPGTYYNRAEASGLNLPLLHTGDTAPVEVTSAPVGGTTISRKPILLAAPSMIWVAAALASLSLALVARAVAIRKRTR